MSRLLTRIAVRAAARTESLRPRDDVTATLLPAAALRGATLLRLAQRVAAPDHEAPATSTTTTTSSDPGVQRPAVVRAGADDSTRSLGREIVRVEVPTEAERRGASPLQETATANVVERRSLVAEPRSSDIEPQVSTKEPGVHSIRAEPARADLAGPRDLQPNSHDRPTIDSHRSPPSVPQRRDDPAFGDRLGESRREESTRTQLPGPLSASAREGQVTQAAIDNVRPGLSTVEPAPEAVMVRIGRVELTVAQPQVTVSAQQASAPAPAAAFTHPDLLSAYRLHLPRVGGP